MGSSNDLSRESVPPVSDVLTLPADKVLSAMKVAPTGLTSDEATLRMEQFGPNRIVERQRRTAVIRFLLSLRSPLVVILLFAGVLAGLLGQPESSVIIFSVVLMSSFLTFYQESKAEGAAEALRERVATTATVMRDNSRRELKLADIVPGDIVMLAAGDIIPGDSRMISGRDLFVDQAALTGESFPAEKDPLPLSRDKLSSETEWDNYLFLGTSVVSGSGTAVVIKTGADTEYGKIAKKVAQRRTDTEFERGLRRFGLLIMEVTFLLVIFVFFVLALKGHDTLESLLFSVALAVGLTPELLPMIVTVNLAKGALSMSKKGVIVKRLPSIQNFGNMDVLCTDKTGTLTEDKVVLQDHVNAEGKRDEKILQYAALNSHFMTGIKSPIDQAILDHTGLPTQPTHEDGHFEGWTKIDELPFDFTRKRVSVVLATGPDIMEGYLITKGAFDSVINISTRCELSGTVVALDSDLRKKVQADFTMMSSEGNRLIAVAYKQVGEKKDFSLHDESDLIFLGFIVLTDPPKETARDSLQAVKESGIELKILTGDNELVTRHVCNELGFEITGIVLGPEIATMHDDALSHIVEENNIFARLTPAQKDRVINAIRRNGHVVGYLGDGINDAPSMRMADVSISVNNAVDVAKESADIILLDKKLGVLHDGVLEGRKTFGNTMKYVLMAISSNFGNMFSAAGAATFLPFLPMLPVQVLLNNLLYDVSELAIPTDNVDKEYVEKPKRLDVTYIRNFMLFFGPISSIFDFLTFFVLIEIFDALHHPNLFRSAWFVESLATQTLVIFAIRTRRFPFFRSKPSRLLLTSSLAMVVLALVVPFTPVGQIFGLVGLPLLFYPILLAFIVGYLGLVETLKRLFYRRYGQRLEKYA